MHGAMEVASKRKRLKQAPAHLRLVETVHDRRSEDLPINSEVRPVIVDDPFAHGEKIVAIQSVRSDTLAFLQKQGTIDLAQYRAGRTLQRFYELATIGAGRGFDPTRVKVDGGGLGETLTEEILRAADEVARLEGVLGLEGKTLARYVLRDGLSIQQCAAASQLFTLSGVRYMGQRFREVLETLAHALSLVGGGPNLSRTK